MTFYDPYPDYDRSSIYASEAEIDRIEQSIRIARKEWQWACFKVACRGIVVGMAAVLVPAAVVWAFVR